MSYPGSAHAASPYGGLSPISEVPVLVSSPANGMENVSQVSSTTHASGQHLLAKAGQTASIDLHHKLAHIQFEKQPPDNMRKSNFFHFIISMFDANQQRIEVNRALFKGFCDTTDNGQEYRNGLVYKVNVVYSDGVQKEEEIHVRLIDSLSKQLIPYEGTCKNPDFRRVLLTHELICSRCLEHRSCGNKNDTPSDPILIDRFRLKFFVKCNQNCLKNAGNPKDSRRRFQVALYVGPNFSDPPIGYSDAMFVHNNSKHGRKPNPVYAGRDTMIGDGKPYIIAVHPHEGWTTGGTSVVIVGMNFYEGTEVVFGTLATSSEYISPNAIAVKTPLSPRPGDVDITLVYQGSQYCINSPGKFLYLAPDEHNFEHNFTRLERLLRNIDDPEDIPKDILLKRAADALETFYTLPRPQNHSAGAAGPLSHIGPIYYPGSPALFALTPQMPQGTGPLFSPNRKVHSHNGGGGGSTSEVSRCSSEEQQVGVETGGSGFFTFPPTEVKLEHAPPSVVYKPKPVTPTSNAVYPVAMPFLQVTPMQTQNPYTGYANVANSSVPSEMNGYMNEEDNRNNNNNSTNNPHNLGYQMMTNWAGNPIHLIPPSPGFIMAPTASPGPLPMTPNIPGGSSMFNFCTPPMISPAKPIRSMGTVLTGNRTTKPGPLSMPSSESSLQGLNYQQTAMLAALPSPGIHGTFVFPPPTPTGLIAPISLPDLSTSNDTATTMAPPQATTAGDFPTSTTEPPPPKKRREDLE